MKIQIPHIDKFLNRFIITISLIFSLTYHSSLSQAKSSDQFTVIIDAGHGGHDAGAVDNGVKEKDINLNVAKAFAAKAAGIKNMNVVMTRDDDTFISLQKRAEIANSHKGDLFISIHTNSVDKTNPNRNKIEGASVYALGPQKDSENLKVARRENSVIELESDHKKTYKGFDPNKDESYIIFEMAQKRTLGQSLRFAGKAQRQLVSVANRCDKGVKQAGFWVLWATSMPAVLVELDFICNAKSAEFLSSSDGVDKLSTALYNALKDYVSGLAYSVDGNESDFDLPNISLGADFDADFDSNDLSESTGSKRSHVIKHSNNRTVTERRRRSSSAKKVSEERSVETDDILVKTESLENSNLTDDDMSSTSQSHSDQSVKENNNKKTKSKKNNKEKTKNSNQKNSSAEKDKNKSSSNRKTFVVKSSQTKLQVNTQPQATKGNEHSVAPAPLTYVILLAESENKLKDNDEIFGGIRPTGHFIENDIHKYIYGASKNRQEIEDLLQQVQLTCPNARIIVRN